jgi:hypothetical protein
MEPTKLAKTVYKFRKLIAVYVLLETLTKFAGRKRKE